MKRNIFTGLILFIIISALIFSGCTNKPASDTTQVTTTGASIPLTNNNGLTVVSANNLFALDLYKNLATHPENAGKNIFFSPFSISSAMAITCEGARGQTAEEIVSVFHYPADEKKRREEYSGINSGLKINNTNLTLLTANALWAEKTHPFLPEYIGTAGHYYGANATNLDFIHMPEDSRVTINKWVEGRTGNKIKELIPSRLIDSDTHLVITNAIYFSGAWKRPFNRKLTSESDFWTTPNSSVRVQMMRSSGTSFNYSKNDHYEMVELPYRQSDGKQLAMFILLPLVNDPSKLENSFDTENIIALQQSLERQAINVNLPRFSFDSGYFLKQELTDMGMPSAFSGTADFSGMDGTRSLSISEVIHKAFINVNEEGTEAAAATVISMWQGAPPLFNANHPFIFIIQDREDGNILFIGRVMNPNG